MRSLSARLAIPAVSHNIKNPNKFSTLGQEAYLSLLDMSHYRGDIMGKIDSVLVCREEYTELLKKMRGQVHRNTRKLMDFWEAHCIDKNVGSVVRFNLATKEQF